VQPTPEPQTLEANSYAVAYRLLGDRPAARAVAGIAAQRLRQAHPGAMVPDDWLVMLTDYTIDQTVGPAALGADEDPADPHSGLRRALRRRLERATKEERVAGALIHLAGYPPDFVAAQLGTTPEQVRSLAGVLAPPPGVAYRDLGDPELTGVARPTGAGTRGRRRRPHWTTVLAVLLVCLAVLYATQVTGPRPTLVEEGGLGSEAVPAARAEVAPDSAERGPADPTDE